VLPEPEIAFFFDSDALIQILLSGQQKVFSILHDDFGVSSFIMSEVDTEVRSNRKFGALVRVQFEEVLKNKFLKIVTAADLERLSADLPAPVSLGDIREIGKDYALFAQKGESYTHAAGVLLQTPTISNDVNAIRSLETNGKKLPPNIFRSYDLFAFLSAEGYIEMQTAERILKTLKTYAEWIPKCLLHSSFENGINGIGCRLLTSLGTSSSKTGWTAPFFLKRRTKDPISKG
jgi:hypothetical protein